MDPPRTKASTRMVSSTLWHRRQQEQAQPSMSESERVQSQEPTALPLAPSRPARSHHFVFFFLFFFFFIIVRLDSTSSSTGQGTHAAVGKPYTTVITILSCLHHAYNNTFMKSTTTQYRKKKKKWNLEYASQNGKEKKTAAPTGCEYIHALVVKFRSLFSVYSVYYTV